MSKFVFALMLVVSASVVGGCGSGEDIKPDQEKVDHFKAQAEQDAKDMKAMMESQKSRRGLEGIGEPPPR